MNTRPEAQEAGTPARVVSDSLLRDVAIAMHASENKTSGWAWEDCSPIEIEGWLELAQAAIDAIAALSLPTGDAAEGLPRDGDWIVGGMAYDD